MRAAVGKELDDLDLLAGLDRLRILEPRVFLAFGQLRRGGERERQGGQSAQADGCKTHHRISYVLVRRRVVLVPRRRAKFNPGAPPRSGVLDDRGIEATVSELRLDAVEFLGVVVGAEPDPIANRF